ncbi:F-box/FBD/LRR-repeat protein [Spatholobus suberectus]|nr:F-box/FBD/LRR-repeat protein [Spatholobus suberectus]
MSGCPFLRALVISYCYGFEHIDVSAPTLRLLNIEGDEVIKSICFKQAQKLLFLKLHADGPGDNIERAWASDLLKDLPKLERLSLGTGYIKILSAGINLQVLLKAVKYLKLNGVNFNEARELLFIISLLESSSNLEKLVTKSNNKAAGPQMIMKEFGFNDCCFSQLQIVHIKVKTDYKHALNLIRFVLAKSSSLKILTFKGWVLGRKHPSCKVI